MKREQARCAKLKEYIEGVRKLMNERENYLQERINLRDKKINSWKEKRKTKLKSADFKTDTNTSIK